jgi:hypothetical protein
LNKGNLVFLILAVLFITTSKKCIHASNINQNTYFLQYSSPINEDFSYGLGFGFSMGMKLGSRFYPEFGFSFIGYDREYEQSTSKQGAFIMTNPGIKMYLFRFKGFETHLRALAFGFNNVLQLSTEHSGFEWDLGGTHSYIGIGVERYLSSLWLGGLEIGYLRISRGGNPLDIDSGHAFTIQVNLINRFRKIAVDREEIF